jgi:hypothetical protein
VFAARRHAPGVEVLDYRGALPHTGASTVTRLGDGPLAARDMLLEQLAGGAGASVDQELEALIGSR